MKMYFFKYLLFVGLSLFLYNSCQKEISVNYFDLEIDEREMVYKESQCSDPWYQYILSFEDTKKTKLELVKDYLNNKSVTFEELIYEKINSDDVVTCTACQCYTGSLYHVKIKYDELVIRKLQELGFKLH